MDYSNWYVITTKPRFEKKVSQQLTDLGIINYVPVQRKLRQWSDRKKWIEVPLFSSYVFVYTSENLRHEVFKINGIVKYLSFCGEITTVSDEEIDRVRRIETYGGDIILEQELIERGDEVEVICGKLTGIKGYISDCAGKNILRIKIGQIGFYATVTIDKRFVRKIELR